MADTIATKLAGYGGTLTYGGTDAQVGKWSGKLMKELHDVSNTASGGWHEYIPGLKGFEGSFEAEWDTTISGSGTYPFPFQDGTAELVVTLGAKNLTCTAHIEDISIDCEVAGTVKFSCSFKATGAVEYNPS